MIIKRNTEKWKEIKGYPFYAVSSFGRIKSLKRKGVLYDRILKPWKSSGGYLAVNLCNGNGKGKAVNVHKIVMAAFKESQPSLLHQCNHEDTDKTNNWGTNLEWMTSKENIKHSIENGLRPLKRGKYKK